jgi:3-hydroxybutyryl-CoA dehydrogenase
VDDIKHVGVIGGGLMGAGIAEVCASAGLDVIVREIDDATAAGLLGQKSGRGFHDHQVSR